MRAASREAARSFCEYCVRADVHIYWLVPGFCIFLQDRSSGRDQECERACHFRPVPSGCGRVSGQLIFKDRLHARARKGQTSRPRNIVSENAQMVKSIICETARSSARRCFYLSLRAIIRSTYLAMTSASRLTSSPGDREERLVSCQVFGMTAMSNVSL